MKGKKPYKPKPIKRHDHTGTMVNFGVLEVGIVAGIRCLGSKETLLLIGAGLAKQKVPDYFYTQHYVRVPLPNQSTLKVYAIKSTDASSLAGRISGRVSLKKAELIDARTGNPSETWELGNRLHDPIEIPPIKMEPIQRKEKTKRIGKFRKLGMLIRRLLF